MRDEKERLFFIVKSWLLGHSAWIFLNFVLILGTINFVQSIIIGASTYIFSLAILRFCDNQINFVVRRILKFLNRHKKTKEFILKHF